MGQILPGVPVWSMASDSRWPGLPLVVFPGNVGGKEALVEALVKVSLYDLVRLSGRHVLIETALVVV